MDQGQKVKPGAPFSFPASVYNRMLDSIKWVERQKRFAGAVGNAPESTATNTLVKQMTGGTLPAFSCLEICGRIGEEQDFVYLRTLKGELPSGCKRPSAITLRGSADGELVECVIAGAVVARVNVNSSYDQYASPVPGSAVLEGSQTPGRFRLVEPVSALGEQKILVAFNYQDAEDCSSGSGSDSTSDCARIPGVDFDTLPIVTDAQYILGVKDGCLVLIETDTCVDEETSAAGGSAGAGSGGGGGGGGGGEPT